MSQPLRGLRFYVHPPDGHDREAWRREMHQIDCSHLKVGILASSANNRNRAPPLSPTRATAL